MKDIKVYFRLLKNPSLLITLLEQDVITIREELFQELLSEEKISYETDLPKFPWKRLYSKSDILSIGIVKYLLENETPKLEKIYKSKKESWIYIAPINKHATYKRAYTYTKRDFIKLINEAYENGLITQEEYEKTFPLQEKTTYEKFLSYHQSEVITIKHNKEDINIPFTSYIDLLNLPKAELEEVLENKELYGMPKEKYINALYSFLAKEHILERYFLPEELLSNLAFINLKIDTYAYEDSLTKLPSYTNEITINDKLYKDILSKVPQDFTKLEKAYYIYYQLCKTFTYDEEYYASTGLQLPIGSKKHEDIGYLEQINQEENQVVCYEFNAIYSKFLEAIGLEYEYTINRRYSSGHEALNFIADKFYISADSTKDGIVYGDMPAAKQGLPLTGFKLLNYRQETQEEFSSSIKKVSDFIKKEEEQERSFNNLVDQYKINHSSLQELTSKECLNILLTSLEKSTLSPTDSLGYVHKLIENLFSNSNAYVEDFFLRENYIENEQKKMGISIVIYYSSKDDSEDEPVKYFLYKPNKELSQISKEELEEKINSGKYQTINDHNKKIPGIDCEKGDSYATKTSSNYK